MNLLAVIEIECPHCGERFEVEVDTSEGDQELVEDCAICCCPVTLEISCQPGNVLAVRSAPG